MSDAALETAARRGEEVRRLLACDAVAEVIGEKLAARREAILNLKAWESREFTRMKAGLEAMEELVAALESVAALGEEARERMVQGAERGRVL